MHQHRAAEKTYYHPPPPPPPPPPPEEPPPPPPPLNPELEPGAVEDEEMALDKEPAKAEAKPPPREKSRSRPEYHVER